MDYELALTVELLVVEVEPLVDPLLVVVLWASETDSVVEPFLLPLLGMG